MKLTLHKKDVLGQFILAAKPCYCNSLRTVKDPLEKLTMKGCKVTNGTPQLKISMDNKETASSTSTRLSEPRLFASFFSIHTSVYFWRRSWESWWIMSYP